MTAVTDRHLAATAPRRRRRDHAGVARRGLRTLVLLAFTLFFAVPLIWLVLATTKSGRQLQSGAPLSWGSLSQLSRNWHQLRAFEGDAFLGWVGNTVEYAFSALVIVLLVDIPAGYALALTHLRLRRPLLLLTLVVMLIPNTVLVLPVFLEVNRVGLIGSAWSVILPFSFFPFGVYLAYLYFSASIPRDLLSAARMDGCSELQVFLKIALPLAKPVVALVGLFSFVANWNNYFLPFVMLPSSGSYPLQVGLVNLPRGGPALALATLVSAVPILVVFLGAQRYVVAGLTAGSTTG